ncbi:hypothetical protein, conserved [Eimeria tenella]|uniref:Transmembrane protein n=1 Tax=Eimeria tenella TaxID=5802 RepID=U6L1K9_EIMTE|nr:hypothetical protein, conserved [Eimeria tenella]CDJ43078.1 hypothetical protein, conserved [Eimeria tenella]|eukprot:XP_013233828.1 hypothetical protein, conserved [Eimeria tenella]
MLKKTGLALAGLLLSAAVSAQPSLPDGLEDRFEGPPIFPRSAAATAEEAASLDSPAGQSERVRQPTTREESPPAAALESAEPRVKAQHKELTERFWIPTSAVNQNRKLRSPPSGATLAGVVKGAGKNQRERWRHDLRTSTLTHALRNASTHLGRMSRRVYQRGEDYWKSPKRRRALVYFSIVGVIMVLVAYAEHKSNMLSVEAQQLAERDSFVEKIEGEVAAEAEAVNAEVEELTAKKNENEEAGKELEAEEDAMKRRKESLREKAAALQEHQLFLRVREAKAQLASPNELEVMGTAAGRKAVLEKLSAIKEEANRLFWNEEALRVREDTAMTKLARLEAEVRSKYHTVLRIMSLEERSPAMRQQTLRLKEELRNSVASLEILVHQTMLLLSEDMWAARAENKLLKNPAAKAELLQSLEAEWMTQLDHQERLTIMQDASIGSLGQTRSQIQQTKRALEQVTTSEEQKRLEDRLYSLQTAELYHESYLRVIDSEINNQLDKQTWLAKMRGLVEEAEKRAKERLKAWSTPEAARAEITGNIEALEGLLSCLDDKLALCFNIHRTWREKWTQVNLV